ncbi:MAG TPA: RHS repeat-associated core domain-containing protein [Caulobacteraceae bacterium]|nr:RHS repeat-associated core domain-containing protein [Caulobacteraceae bacterium]
MGEYNGSTILNRCIPGPGADEALLWYSGAGTSTANWLEADNLGSTVAWSNSSGANQKMCAYEEFGSPGACGWGAGPRYRFTGQLEIPEGHVYDFKARAYQDKLGRFLQVDPMGLAAGLNLYAYAGNDPINQSDPSGMYWDPDSNAVPTTPGYGGGAAFDVAPVTVWGCVFIACGGDETVSVDLPTFNWLNTGGNGVSWASVRGGPPNSRGGRPPQSKRPQRPGCTQAEQELSDIGSKLESAGNVVQWASLGVGGFGVLTSEIGGESLFPAATLGLQGGGALQSVGSVLEGYAKGGALAAGTNALISTARDFLFGNLASAALTGVVGKQALRVFQGAAANAAGAVLNVEQNCGSGG